MTKGKKILLYTGLSLLAVLAAGAAGFVIWAVNGYTAEAEARLCAERADGNDPITFGDGSETAGFIYYPGARVESGAYACFAEELSSYGYLTVIPDMPLNLAIFGRSRADGVMEAFPEVEDWYLGGHSLGGAMGSFYAAGEVDRLAGFIFTGSYPGGDLSETNLPVLSVYGGRDGLSTPEDIRERRDLLSEDTVYKEIKEGNHANFGTYGAQSGDLKSPLAPEEQQAETARLIHEWIMETGENSR
ncbi:alpha/beta hydrolase [Alteribacter natronophilus]|uniref:alpha/beta hydrolase n=1 Tax=Alteribacter natronophilus TaxID=2583810 RepID=UPI00110EF947|nr:alpha/beta hydrolase [Alteribacter natronophilus]TMW70869.1 alpha/beta hydrolase [Alteribacter natronophilus]